MGKDEWTIMDVIRAAVIQLGIRSAVAFGMSLLAAVGLRMLIAALESQIGLAIWVLNLGITLLFSFAFGYPQGLVMSRGAAGRIGLSGGGMMAIAYVLIVAINCSAYFLCAWYSPDWQSVWFYLLGGVAIFSLTGAGKTLLGGG